MSATKPAPKKLPRARMGYCNSYQLSYINAHYSKEGLIYGTPDTRDPDSFSVAVLPTHTPTQAKRIVKMAPFLGMTEEEQLRVVVTAMDAACVKAGLGNYRNIVAGKAALRAVLRCMGLGGRGGKP